MTSEPTPRSLQRQLDRLESRLAAIETVVFKLNPSSHEDTLDSVEAVKTFLRKNNIAHMPPHVCTFLLERLPADWRMLASQHGAQQAFKFLSENYSIVEARRKLS